MTQRVVTVDFGSSGLRAVQFSLGKNRAKAEKVGVVPLPRGAIDAGDIKDSEVVKDALRNLWSTHKFQTKKVVFGVASGAVLVREMTMDWMPAADFRRALGYQVQDELGLDPATTTLDYHILGDYQVPSEDGQTFRRMARILLVAALNEQIAAFSNTIQAAGLLPVRADLLPFALTSAITPIPAEPGTAEALIEIGADVTSIVIHQNGQPRYVRTYAGQGGNAITEALVNAFGWKWHEAESTKHALGIPTQVIATTVSDSVFGVPVDQEPQAPVAEHQAVPVITNFASRAIQEIRSTISFFLESNGQIDTLSRVVLSGGASLLNGFTPRLASELRVPIDYATPLSLVTVAPKAVIPDGVTEQQMSASIGLALGGSR